MVKPKKYLGQHFLINKGVIQKIIDAFLELPRHFTIEVGAGTGALTEYIIKHLNKNEFIAVDIDEESILFLKNKFPDYASQFLVENFLSSIAVDQLLLNQTVNIIGNFPYNISSQIMFKILEHKDNVQNVLGMFQKEVAERICASPSNKEYGILSVLLQTYYSAKYLFTVNEGSFNPPPKVKSAVILLKKKTEQPFGFNTSLYVDIIKTAFNQRRKTLKNSLKKFGRDIEFPYKDKRPEQIDFNAFIEITNMIEKQK